MNTTRGRQIRLERKRRRRERRKERQEPVRSDSGPVQLEQKWSQAAVFTRDGRPADPAKLAAHLALGPMSDALLKLLEPYVEWPPAREEIEDCEKWLELGATVWNATVKAPTNAELHRKLESIVEEWDLSDEDDPVALVEEIATRKLRLFGEDNRLVGSVRLRAEGGIARVEAMSLAYLP